MSVVVTGASSGIGLEAALAFSRDGRSVIATMRDIEKATVLQSRAAAEDLDINVKQLDVARSDTFVSLIDDIVDTHGPIDVLINNAGIHRGGALEDLTIEAFRSVMETNCIGPLLLTRAVLPYMRRQKNGLVIMMGSLSGIAGLPGDVAYAASKFALEGATEALRHEVDRWGIRVALVEAGLHKTSIMTNNFFESSPLPADYPSDSPYRPLIEWQLGRAQERILEARDPALIAALFVTIANSDEARLRWPADPQAENVLATMLAQSDADRDEFLRTVAGTDWWSRGNPAPTS